MAYTTPTAGTAGQVLTATNYNVLVNDVIALAVPPACRAIQAAAQTTTDSVATAIVFGAESYDTDTMHDNVTNNTRITIRTAGIYVVTAGLGLTSAPVSAFELYLDQNNGTRIAECNDLGPSYKTISTTKDFAVNDYIEMKIYADGARVTRYASLPLVTFMTATMVGRTA
jgi:hypothetical protein